MVETPEKISTGRAPHAKIHAFFVDFAKSALDARQLSKITHFCSDGGRVLPTPSPGGTTRKPLVQLLCLGRWASSVGQLRQLQRPKKATELSSRCRRYLTTQAAEAKSGCRAGKSTSSAVRTLKNGPYRSSIGRGTQPRVTITAHVRMFCLFLLI